MQREEPTLYIIEGDPNILTGLRTFFDPHPISIQHFSHPQAFLKNYSPDGPGCVLSDLRLPDMTGAELLLILQEQSSCLPLILMASLREMPTSPNFLNTGVYAFLEKPLHSTLLLATIKSAFKRSQDMKEYAERMNRLTVREREVFSLLVEGHTNKVIAKELDVTDKTVEAHRASIMRKTESGSLANLIHLNNQLTLRPQ
jgi:FixJ family two-component response regulator